MHILGCCQNMASNDSRYQVVSMSVFNTDWYHVSIAAQYKSTTLFMAKLVSCAAGIACSAAHSRSELRAEAAVLHNQKPYTYRFALCESFYKTGQCRKGVLCDDAHGIEEVRSDSVHTPCLCCQLTCVDVYCETSQRC